MATRLKIFTPPPEETDAVRSEPDVRVPLSSKAFFRGGDPVLAAAAVLGVLGGSRIGFWFGGRARAKWLKVLMAVVLAAVSLLYFKKALL